MHHLNHPTLGQTTVVTLALLAAAVVHVATPRRSVGDSLYRLAAGIYATAITVSVIRQEPFPVAVMPAIVCLGGAALVYAVRDPAPALGDGATPAADQEDAPTAPGSNRVTPPGPSS
ncbi:hypothetical protein [Streptomyces sp. NBC_00470]|uniref:hypothetical protein n=1 Tax=Streptomyces sp. NBC_00470 TaxID=2975753 RepID=UPI002F91921B